MVSEHRFAFIVLKSVFALVLYRFQKADPYTDQNTKGAGRKISPRQSSFFLKKETQINADVTTVPGWEKLRFPLTGNVPYVGC